MREADMDKNIFAYDPLIGCPFDDSEMQMVESWKGFSVGTMVEFLGPNDIGTTRHLRIRGIISAIGENAKYFDGKPFVAFAIQVKDGIYFKTHQDIYHVL